jgi:hypothetical protein
MQMSDSESRLTGARFFLDCARKTDRNRSEYRWYIQATASFAIAATEILYYEYGVHNGLFPRGPPHNLDELKRSHPNHPFFGWLFRKLEMGVPKNKKSPDGLRYAFLREERNSILHRGEKDKRKINIHHSVGSGPPSVTTAFYFVNWDSEACELVCERTIAFVESIIGEASKLGYL